MTTNIALQCNQYFKEGCDLSKVVCLEVFLRHEGKDVHHDKTTNFLPQTLRDFLNEFFHLFRIHLC